MAGANTFKLEVITPDRIFYTGEAQMVELTTTEGDVGIYAEHIPMTAIVAPGILTITESKDSVKEASLLEGFIEIMPDQITILAQSCEWPDEIDEKRAQKARDPLSDWDCPNPDEKSKKIRWLRKLGHL